MATKVPPSYEQLQAEAHELHRQVRALMRAEQRLFQGKHEIDRQLRRINAVNQFALKAASHFESQQILLSALETLVDLLAVDQSVALICQEDHHVVASGVLAQEGLEPIQDAFRFSDEVRYQSSEPLVGTFDEIVGSTPEARSLLKAFCDFYDGENEAPRNAVFAMVTLRAFRDDTHLGYLLLRTNEPSSKSIHEKVPGDEEVTFLKLFATHVQSSLENAMLRERLEVLNADLERRVASRTEDLTILNSELESSLRELHQTQEQLFQAGKMAAMGTLIAGLSHELNTPLAVILGYAQTLIEHAELAPEMQMPLEAIARQARRCSQLVESLLSFSRRKPTTREAIDPSKIVQQVYALTRAHASRMQITFDFDDANLSSLPSLFVNATELESAVLNLVRNAIDAAGEGGHVSLAAVTKFRDDRQGVEFEVSDSGVGIPPEIQPSIFDPFFTTKDVGEGTGLGLALTRRVVDTYEGEIDLQSEVNKGTIVRLWIPTIFDMVSQSH